MIRTLALCYIVLCTDSCAAEMGTDQDIYDDEVAASQAPLFRLPDEPYDTGVACKVIGGSNTGKSGTLDSDGSCCGAWGCTDCKDSAGKDNGKCSSKTSTRGTYSVGDKTVGVAFP